VSPGLVSWLLFFLLGFVAMVGWIGVLFSPGFPGENKSQISPHVCWRWWDGMRFFFYRISGRKKIPDQPPWLEVGWTGVLFLPDVRQKKNPRSAPMIGGGMNWGLFFPRAAGGENKSQISPRDCRCDTVWTMLACSPTSCGSHLHSVRCR